MARIVIPNEERCIEDPAELNAYLAPHGIFHERWEMAERVAPDASADEILTAYAPEIERLKSQGGYVTADVISVTPDMPGLDAMLEKFRSEHTHLEDEVRFILKGNGLFHIRPIDGPVFAIHVEAGDLINVPLGTRHWFNLCSDRTIRAIRLFQEKTGWTPYYSPDGVHGGYEPVCWGPTFVKAGAQPATLAL